MNSLMLLALCGLLLVSLLYLLIAYLRSFVLPPPVEHAYPIRCAGCGAELVRTGTVLQDESVLCGACGVVTI